MLLQEQLRGREPSSQCSSVPLATFPKGAGINLLNGDDKLNRGDDEDGQNEDRKGETGDVMGENPPVELAEVGFQVRIGQDGGVGRQVEHADVLAFSRRKGQGGEKPSNKRTRDDCKYVRKGG